MDQNYEIIDRYSALGIPRPDPATICKGQCEGVGYYPQFLDGPWVTSSSPKLENITIPVIKPEDLPAVLGSPGKIPEDDTVTIAFDCPDPTDEEIRRWHEAHNVSDAHSGGKCDGWHFIKCPDCNGTGKRK